MSADAREKRLKLTSTDEETGTKFSIIDKSGGLPGTDPCKGGYGDLEVIGEVPSNISLADDTVAQALVEKGKDAATKACPRFSIGGRHRLDLWLLKGNYSEEVREPLYRNIDDNVVKAPWEVYAHWEKHYPREPMSKKYINAAIRRAKLASEVVQPLPNKDFLFLLGTDKKTSVNFWIYSKERTKKCWSWSGGEMWVLGEVPQNISLLDDRISHSLIIDGAKILLDNCPDAVKIKQNSISIFLVPVGFHVSVDQGITTGFSPIKVVGNVHGGFKNQEWPKITGIKNYVLEAEKQRLERKKQEKERAEVRRRYDEFVRKYGVKEWPSPKEFFVNPFVYEGKIVAIELEFSKMLSATEGLFSREEHAATLGYIVVSNIPKGLFTSRKQVVLAGRVMGKKEGVPHLKFVGVHFCKDWSCSDIITK